ncbi:MAG: CRISPR-associated endonuclease Cas2 [Aliarcobacter sp.]|nr:CRISPR-associated endonuclease Cas2 [Aliarcobacter sp.]
MEKNIETPNAISGYRKMVLFVMFDMPTETHEDLEKYRKFRSKLIELGFIMFQYSVYVRFCRSLVIAEKYEKKVELAAPLNGSIRIMKITEAQYKNMKVIENYREKPEEKIEEQIQTLMVF